MSHVFVDVSNVASIRKGERGYAPWFDAIKICEAWLAENPNDNMTLVVDWGFHGYLQHNFLEEFASFTHARDAQKVRFAKSGKTAPLIEAPENIAADEYILRRADRYADRQIIAEDHYRPYRDDFPWLQGFALQLPVFRGENVHFEPLYLRPIDEYEIEVAEEEDEEEREMLEKTRAARRNRHQRRRAARNAPPPARSASPRPRSAIPTAFQPTSSAKPATRASTTPVPAPKRAGQVAKPTAKTPAKSTSGANSQRNGRSEARAGRRLPIWTVPMLAVASIAVSYVLSRVF